MKMKRLLSIALASIITFTPVLSFGNTLIYNEMYINKNLPYSLNIDSSKLEHFEHEERVLFLKPVAKAAWARLSTSSIVSRITVSVSTVALNFAERNATQKRSAVSNAPNIYGVHDAVFRAMVRSGATESMARSIANAVNQWVY